MVRFFDGLNFIWDLEVIVKFVRIFKLGLVKLVGFIIKRLEFGRGVEIIIFLKVNYFGF